MLYFTLTENHLYVTNRFFKGTEFYYSKQQPTIYRATSMGRELDLLEFGIGLIPVAGGLSNLINDGAKYVMGNREITTNSYSDLANSIISGLEIGSDIGGAAFDIVENLGKLNGVDYLGKLGKGGKVLKGVGDFISVVGWIFTINDARNLFLSNSYQIEQIVDQCFGKYMFATSRSSVEQKYSMAYSLVSSLLSQGRLTYESNFWGKIESYSFGSNSDYDLIVDTLMAIDKLNYEYQSVVDELYWYYLNYEKGR